MGQMVISTVKFDNDEQTIGGWLSECESTNHKSNSIRETAIKLLACAK